MDIQVLTVTSKGKISLPINMRKKSCIDIGDSLVAYTIEDTVVLKKDKKEFDWEFKKALSETKQWAESVGYKEKDVNDIIKTVRKNHNRIGSKHE